MTKQSQVLQRACFELRKWARNRAELLTAVPEVHQQPIVFSDNESSALKVLVLQWNSTSVVSSYSVKPIGCECTKRNIFSEKIEGFYEPLGFITPVVLIEKWLMQQMWRDGLPGRIVLQMTLSLGGSLISNNLRL